MENHSTAFGNQDRKGRVKYLVSQIPKVFKFAAEIFVVVATTLCVCLYIDIILEFVSFYVINIYHFHFATIGS